MTATSDSSVTLSPNQQRLLARLRQQATGDTAAPLPPVRPRETDGPAPLSYAQRRLWFIQHMHSEGVAYNAPMVNRIVGRLDVEALREALRTVIQRHESLRTTFPEVDGDPVQVVGEVPEPVLSVVALDHLPPQQRDTNADELLLAEARAPFDLATGPMLRSALIRLAPEEHLLIINIHHITSDAWSMGVLVRELGECYAAYREGRAPDLDELPVSYADYSVWQRDQMAGPARDRAIEYWQRKLAGATQLDLPADRVRPPVPSHDGAITMTILPGEFVGPVRLLARRAGGTPFTVFLAAFFGLLHRYTGEQDLTIGTSIAGRETDEVTDLIGFFVNTLVLRADVGGDPSFLELLDRVKRTTLDAQAHQDLPFDLLIDHLKPARDPSRLPLVSVMFQQDNTPDCAVRLPGLDVELLDFDPGTAKFDLLISVRMWDDAIRLHAVYNTDLFDRHTIDCLLGAYRTFLAHLVTEPTQPVSTAPLLTLTEATELVLGRNRTETPLGGETRLHDLFHRQATQRPEAVAMIAAGHRYTFAGIERRANQLAHHLRGLGVGPDVRVAVCVPRGVQQFTAVLAVLKAGGAYVPIDPDYPATRISRIVTDSAAVAVLTANGVDLPELAPPVLDLDGLCDTIDLLPTEVPETEVTPDNLCYVLYTSGSTGLPKGIGLRHRGVVNTLLDLNTRFDVGPEDRALALSSPCFDLSVYDLFGITGAGGTALTLDPELAKDPGHWLDLITQHRVTIWQSAPPLAELMMEQAHSDPDRRPDSLRLAIFGGDWLRLTAPERLRALAPNIKVFNLGGATEASVHSTIFSVDTVDPAWPSIPYGLPLANQRVFALDDRLRPVPVGVPGHLFFGGAGLAAGYLGAAAELNADRFIDWSWPGIGTQRIYRSGDVVRWRSDGQLELLGRVDSQVKLHGLRIELGEVETALAIPNSVRASAAVVHRGDGGTDDVLVGYVVPQPGAEIDIEEIRAAAKDVLASYMVPSAFVVLDALPLNNSGKVDRRALPAPDRSASVGDVTEGPRGEWEQRVADVWCKVLGLTEIGRDTDFFAAGGDSFKAVRAVREIDRALPVIELFRQPTVAGLARTLGSLHTGPRPLLYRLTKGTEGQTPVVALPYGGGNAIAYQPLADNLPAGIDLWAVALPGHDLADGEPLADLREIAGRCAEEIIERVAPRVALYGHCAGGATTVAVARELEARGAEVTATIIGASFPDADPAASSRMIETSTPDQLLAHLRRLGGFDGVLDEDDVLGIIEVVRHDLAESVRFFAGERETRGVPLNGPLHVVVGADDPATANHAERYLAWAPYAATLSLAVVPEAGHYFCKHHPAEVAGIIADVVGVRADRSA